MKKILALISIALVCCLMPISLFGCNSQKEPAPTGTGTAPAGTNAPTTDAPTAEPTEKPTGTGDADKSTDKNDAGDDNGDISFEDLEEKTYAFKNEEDLAHFKRIGRTVVAKKYLCCDNTASGIEFDGVFEGEVNLTVRVEVLESKSPVCFFTVYIDGERVEDTYNSDGDRTEGAFRVSEGESVVTLAEFDEPGRHTIRIVKQSGPRLVLASFKELSVTGYLLDAPKDKELYIEVIGDSITSGQGTAGYNATAGNVIPNADRVDFADGTKTYAYLTAEEFDADYSIISESAIALNGSWFDNGRTIFDHYASYSYKREDARNKYPFDFENERVPDLVVIYLGTNDDALASNGKTDAAKTKEAAKRLISTIRDGYGEAVPIVWAIGGSGNIWGAIKEAITELGGENSDIYTVNFRGDSAGHTSHPSADAHKEYAQTLIACIKEKKIFE